MPRSKNAGASQGTPTPHSRTHDVAPQATWSPGICPACILLHGSTLNAHLPSTPRFTPLGSCHQKKWRAFSTWLGEGLGLARHGSDAYMSSRQRPVCMSVAGVGVCPRSTGGSECPPQCVGAAPDKGCGYSKDPKARPGQHRAVLPFLGYIAQP